MRINAKKVAHLKMTRDLTDKVAVVIGGSSGMGRASALAFAQAGARVVLSARRQERLDEAAREIAAQGGTAIAHAADTQKPEDVERLVEKVRAELGRIDILLYATGTNVPRRAIDQLSFADWSSVLATNLTGAFVATQAVLPTMLEQGEGLIIYLSTGAAKQADVSGVSYQASKRGLDGLAQGVMKEVKGKGVIRTTVIYPGLCDTEMLLKRPTPTPPEIVAKALLPEDVAEASLFVASLPPRVHIPELSVYPAEI